MSYSSIQTELQTSTQDYIFQHALRIASKGLHIRACNATINRRPLLLIYGDYKAQGTVRRKRDAPSLKLGGPPKPPGWLTQVQGILGVVVLRKRGRAAPWPPCTGG